jgi:putative colanic acid biosynthesis UDP-glucose lipid carrier transferase
MAAIMTINDIPLVSLFKRLVDPAIVIGLWYLLTCAHGEVFGGHDMALAIITFFIASHVYDEFDCKRAWRSGRVWAYARDIFIGWAIVVAVLVVIGQATGLAHQYSPRVILLWFALTPFALLASHLAVRQLTGDRRRAGEMRSAVIVGINEMSERLAAQIDAHPGLFMQLCGFFEDRTPRGRPWRITAPVLGPINGIADYVRERNIKLVFISLPMSEQPRIRRLIDELHDTTASIYFLPDIYGFDIMQARFDNVGGVPVVAVCETPFTGINSVVKRASDILLGSSILLALAPVMLAVALAVKLTSRGPVIFKQRRYGLNGDAIIVYKFRSMTVCEDGANIVQARKNDQRVTKVGAFLRRSSLDELPQFINVLQGRMSIVGPRPHAVAHNEMYRKLIKGYMLRHKAKPGITGWAQVNGLRGETDTLDKMQARIEYDLAYLRSWSLPLDLWIIARTLKVFTARDNAY